MSPKIVWHGFIVEYVESPRNVFDSLFSMKIARRYQKCLKLLENKVVLEAVALSS